MLEELKILIKFAEKLKIDKVKKTISNEYINLEKNSELDTKWIKEIIDIVNDKALKKRQENLNYIKSWLQESNNQKKYKITFVNDINKILYDWNRILETNKSKIDQLNEHM